MHSVGGWGAITTGKNLAMTLFDLLGYHIKANPKYGSEKKGQPTTYYLSAAPEPIRINCEYVYVDVVLSPDPNVFGHSNPLAGLKKGGVFILQSARDVRRTSGRQIPERFQQIIVDNEIRVFYPRRVQDRARGGQRSRAAVPHAGQRLSGRVLRRIAGDENARSWTKQQLFRPSRSQLEHKFGDKGARVVEDNIRVVRRGFDEIHEITEKKIAAARRADSARPVGLAGHAEAAACGSSDLTTDIHRFWEQTGSFYATGQGNDNLADPFIGAELHSRGDRRVPRHDAACASSIRSGSPKTAPPAEPATPSARTAPFPVWCIPICAIFETALKNRAKRDGAPLTQSAARDPRAWNRSCATVCRRPMRSADVRQLLDEAIAEVKAG